jgi:hypothetical protein
MPTYRQRMTYDEVLPATIDEVWAYVTSREAQVKHDPRFQRIDVIEGRWGEPGSRITTTGTLPSGQQHTWDQELVRVEAPSLYETRSRFPDGTTTGTSRFRSDADATHWEHEIEIVTRGLSVFEYLALIATGRARRRQAAVDHQSDVDYLVAALRAVRETGPTGTN